MLIRVSYYICCSPRYIFVVLKETRINEIVGNINEGEGESCESVFFFLEEINMATPMSLSSRVNKKDGASL